MHVSATIRNSLNQHETNVSTNGQNKRIQIDSKSDGFGSSINDAELLLLSIATCFCNDIYREAERKAIDVRLVEVTVSGNFAREHEPGSDIRYRVDIIAPDHPQSVINALIRYVDEIAEIHRTIRLGTPVVLEELPL